MDKAGPFVFVSLTRKDQERAADLLEALGSLGVPLLRFGDLVGPDGTWQTEFPKLLDQAAVVLVVWTRASKASDWVPREAELAARAGKLVPVTLDGFEAVPVAFSSSPTVDLTSWSGAPDDPAFVRLHKELESRLPMTAAPESAAPQTAAPQTAAPQTAAPQTAAPESGVSAPLSTIRREPKQGPGGEFQRLGRTAVTALEYAEGLRRRLGLGEVHMEHLVEALFQEGVGRRELGKAGLGHDQLLAIVAEVAHTTLPTNVRPHALTAMPPLSKHATRAVDNARRATRPRSRIQSTSLWVGALAVEECGLVRELRARGVGPDHEPGSTPEEPSVPASESPEPDRTREHVGWVFDDPVAIDGDTLGRLGVAEALDSKLRELAAKSSGRSFLVHVDGSWGAGKSTLLRFLHHLVSHPRPRVSDTGPSSVEKDTDRWLCVDYDAWRQQRAGQPWLTLLQAVRAAVRREQGWWWNRAWFGVRERARLISRWQWTALIVMAVLTALVALALIAADSGISVTQWGDLVKLVGGLLPVVAATWLLAGLAGRFLSLDSRRSAQAFMENRADPMEDLATHFQWVLRQAGRTVVLLVDDLDRCPETFVVDLLDAVQKLMREPLPLRPRGPDRPDESSGDATVLVVVVAADGRWIRQAYDNAFASLDKAVREPGATIGSLFLEKLFQLTLPVPQLPDQLKQEYFTSLLSEEGAVPGRTASTADLAKEVAEAPRNQVLDVLTRASPADRRQVADQAIRRLVVEAGAEQETKHALEPFGSLMDPTPRAMKRFAMAYDIFRAVRTAEGSVVPVGPLALWTVLVTRWPLLAEYLQSDPSAVRLFSASPERIRASVPSELSALFEDPPDDLRAVMNHPAGPLDARLIRECCGQFVRP